jgi:putative phosphoesterase
MQVGILSDTHGYIHPSVFDFFREVDEIWHAGDLGPGVLEQLMAVKPVRAVYGNIDGREIRAVCSESFVFTIEEVTVFMVHIGGTPGSYDRKVLATLLSKKPQMLVCGHSHILKVMFDKKHNLLFVNPGAAGKYGWHKSITAIRLTISGGSFSDMEVLDVPRNSG